jgi:Uma2 family endonuclease
MSALASPTLTVNGKGAAVPADYIFRLSVEQYHQMIQAGILTKDDPVELLEGWLVLKIPKKPAHPLATQLTRTALERATPPGWFVDSQEPVTLDDSEAEPDVRVVRGDRRQYRNRHPGPQDLAMLVEVAESSLKRDRGWKKLIYARAQIPVYWLINLTENCVEVFSDPSGPTDQPDYRQHKIFGSADEVPVVIEGKEVARLGVKDLLP